MMWCHDDCAPVQAEPGVTRRVLARSDTMTMAEISFETGAQGAMHKHPHEQVSYVLRGAFTFTIGGETHAVRAGDSVHMPPNILHGVTCRENGALLDVFTPARADFL